MNTPESQAILREVQRRTVRNAELNWEDITANKSFLLVASLMFYKVGEMELDKLCEDYFDIDTVPDGDAIDYNLSIAEKVLTCTNPKYQALKKRAEKVKKENTCECCEGWGYGDIGLATGDNGVEMWVCRFCDVDGSNYNGWGEHHCSECGMEDGDCDCDDAEPIQCYGCGDPDCVEPEDPMDAECVAEVFKPKIGNCNDCNQELVEGYYWSRPDKNLMFCADCGQSVLDEEKEEEAMGAEDKDAPAPRFCESCNEESKRISEKLDKHNEEMDKRHNPPDTPALIERMRIQVQNEYGKMTNKQLYEWIILNKKPDHKIRKNQKKEELLNLIVLIKTKIV